METQLKTMHKSLEEITVIIVAHRTFQKLNMQTYLDWISNQRNTSQFICELLRPEERKVYWPFTLILTGTDNWQAKEQNPKSSTVMNNRQCNIIWSHRVGYHKTKGILQWGTAGRAKIET